MNRGLLAISLLLSVPVALGVVGAVDVTLGELPLALFWGTVTFLAIFLFVYVGGSRGTIESGDDVVTGVAEEAPPDADERAVRPARSADLLMGAGVGALLTVFVWYIPGSPLLGGTVAGYLADGTSEDALRAAVLAGLFVPLVVLFVASAAFLIAGAQVLGRFPFGPTVAVAVALAGVVYVVGFSVAGGKISVSMREG